MDLGKKDLVQRFQRVCVTDFLYQVQQAITN